METEKEKGKLRTRKDRSIIHSALCVRDPFREGERKRLLQLTLKRGTRTARRQTLLMLLAMKGKGSYDDSGEEESLVKRRRSAPKRKPKIS